MGKFLFLNNLFGILQNDIKDDGCLTKISINPDHPVFEGHFPDNPITPGVCILQMVKETIMNNYNVALQMDQLKHSKFLAFINPEKQQEVDFQINIKHKDQTHWQIAAVVKSENAVHAKFSGRYKLN